MKRILFELLFTIIFFIDAILTYTGRGPSIYRFILAITIFVVFIIDTIKFLSKKIKKTKQTKLINKFILSKKLDNTYAKLKQY
jgi:hypothetical protein